MKRKSVYTCLVMLLMSLVLQAKDKDVAVAEALLKRLLPSYIESFQFQKLKGEKDCFTICLLYTSTCGGVVLMKSTMPMYCHRIRLSSKR